MLRFETAYDTIIGFLDEQRQRLCAAAMASVCAVTLAGCASQTASAESALGYDVSWPQCGQSLPEPSAFAIVGVNEDLPRKANPCFGEQLAWAQRSTGQSTQPKVAVYATAANPAQENVDTWPQSGSNQYGECDGQATTACAFTYGQDRMDANKKTVETAGAKVGDFKWWIDVEPEYSWESDASGKVRNRAMLEGMVDVIIREGGQVGFYSDKPIWGNIVGEVPQDSSLFGKDNWMRGAHTPEEAQKNCQLPSFNGGRVVMAQIVADGQLDRDYSCV